LLEGKFLTANLSTIGRGGFRKQNINIHFKVDKVSDGKAYTSIIEYSLINAAIKRLVRRGRDKISDSFLVKTKDKKVLRVKPLIITMNKVTKSVQSAVRLETRRVVREFAFTKSLEEVFGSIIEGKLQKIIKEASSKITLLKSIEIRRAKVYDASKVVITEDGVKTEAVKIRRNEKGEKVVSEEERAPVLNSIAGEDVPVNLDEDGNPLPEPSEEISEESSSEEDDVELSTADDDEDFGDEEESLIEEGEELAEETTEIEEEPETLIEEMEKEDSENESSESKTDDSDSKKE
jgi:ribosomal protein S3AE